MIFPAVLAPSPDVVPVPVAAGAAAPVAEATSATFGGAAAAAAMARSVGMAMELFSEMKSNALDLESMLPTGKSDALDDGMNR